MPIQPEDKTPLETVTIKVRRDQLEMAHAFAQFLKGSSLSHIYGASLAEEIARNKEFAAWLKDHPEASRLPGDSGKKAGRPAAKAKGAGA